MRKMEVERHRLAFFLVLEADSIGIDELALAGDEHNRAGKLAVADGLAQRRVDPIELLLGNSDLLGLRLRQRQIDLTPGRGRSNKKRRPARR